MRVRRYVIDACDGPFGSATASDHYSKEGARVVRLGNIGVSEWKDDDAVYIPLEYWRSLTRHHTEEGDVVVAALGDDNHPVGRAAVVPNLGSALVKADCHRLRIDQTVADPRFIAYALSSARGRYEATRMAEGSTRRRLTLGKTMSLPVPDFPLDEQRRIADRLDSVTDRIASVVDMKRRLAALLDERLTLALDEVLGFNTETRIELRRVVDPRRPIMYGIVLPGPDNPGGPIVVKGGNVRDGTVTGHLCGTTVEIEAGYRRSRLRRNDTVVVIRGAGAGRVGVVPYELDGANITQDVARVAPGDRMDGAFLRLSLQAAECQRQLLERVGGAAITGINIADLKRVQIPWLPLDGQRRRAAEASEVVDQARRIQATLAHQIQLLREHRHALAEAALNGEVGA